MALPGGLTTITVTGQFLAADGTPARGTVSFTPSAAVAYPARNVIFPPVPLIIPLSGTGTVSVTLPCTDNPGLGPAGGGAWSYTVAETITGAGSRSYPLVLPHTLGSPVDLSSVLPSGVPAVVAAGPATATASAGNPTAATGAGAAVTAAAGSAASAGGTAPSAVVTTATTPVTVMHVGAYVSGSPDGWAWQPDTATAVAVWTSATHANRPLTCQRFYAGQGAMPTAPWPDWTAALAAGRRILLSYKPLYVTATNLPPLTTSQTQSQLDDNVNTFLTAMRTAGFDGTNTVIDLWQESYTVNGFNKAGHSTYADFVAMFRHYAPIIRGYGFPVAWCTAAGNGLAQNGEDASYPGDAYVDVVATDFYTGAYQLGCRLSGYDPAGTGQPSSAQYDAFYHADRATPPKPCAIYETGGTLRLSNGISVSAFVTYLQGVYTSRAARSLPNGDITWFNSGNDANNSPICVADGQAETIGGSGTNLDYGQTEIRNALFAQLYDAFEGTGLVPTAVAYPPAAAAAGAVSQAVAQTGTAVTAAAGAAAATGTGPAPAAGVTVRHDAETGATAGEGTVISKANSTGTGETPVDVAALVTYNAAAAIHGSWGFTANITTSGTAQAGWSASSGGSLVPAAQMRHFWGRVYITYGGSAGSSVIDVARVSNTTPTTQFGIGIDNATGKIGVYRRVAPTGFAALSASALAAGTHRIEFEATYDSTSGNWTVTAKFFYGANREGTSPDETLSPAAFAGTAGVDPGRFVFGALTGAAQSWSVKFDDPAISTLGPIGPV